MAAATDAGMLATNVERAEETPAGNHGTTTRDNTALPPFNGDSTKTTPRSEKRDRFLL